MRKILIATLAGIIFYLTPLPALSAQKAGDMESGVWKNNPRYITFGAHNGHPLVWRVLEVKDNDMDSNGIKTAFLLLDDLLKDSRGNVEMRGFDEASNSFPNSKINEWLNDDKSGFLTSLGDYQQDILDATYGPDHRKWHGGPASGTSKCYLLSVREANNANYFSSDADRSIIDNRSSWWLRSPGFENNIATSVLHFGGVARNGPFVFGDSGVRPVLKISLSPSSAFVDIPVHYELAVKTENENNIISGAKVSLTSHSMMQNVERFSNSTGMTRFGNVTPGEYTVVVSKPGYITKSLDITISASVTPALSLTHDPTSLQDKVKFGKYNAEPIEWVVIDIVNDKALLLAGALFERYFDFQGSSAWANSSLRAYLNSSINDDFLQEANFTPSEAAAIDASASATGDSVFLLSSEEAYRYLPDANMRYFDDKAWLTRTPHGEEDVEAISPDGEYGGGIPVFSREVPGWSRPAMWVDLSLLTLDHSTNTLLPK